MKNISRYSLALCLSLVFGMTSLQASTIVPTSAPTTTPTTTVDPRTEQLTKRLEQIQGMDKSQMSAKERKALRKEVKQIKRSSSGIYLSAGAIIIIVILLILLL